MSLQQRTTSDLLYLLDRAYPGQDVALIKCVACDNGARVERPWTNDAQAKRRQVRGRHTKYGGVI